MVTNIIVNTMVINIIELAIKITKWEVIRIIKWVVVKIIK